MCAACGGSPSTDSSPAPSDAAPQSAPDPTSTPSPTSTSEPAKTPEPTPMAATPEVEAADVEMDSFIRGLTFDYWDAFNDYDADTVLGYFETSYRQEREEFLRADIGTLKLFGVKLGVSEESPPTMVAPNEWEMYVTMKEPLGTRIIQMVFKEIDGEWKVTYSEEVK